VPAEPLVRVVRSGLEESVHLGHVAVCDARGRLLASLGDPDRRVFVRSCMKPLQAAVSLSAIGGVRLNERQVAVMCASHTGEPVHVRTVRSVLRRGGLTEDDLRTPAALPEDRGTGVRAARPIFHNCSGKHAGMLLACVVQGWEPTTYRNRSHPLQRRVLSAVRMVSGVPQPSLGVDGCGVPVHGMRMRDVATMYARLAGHERLGDLAPPTSRALSAMRAEPGIVGGLGRGDTVIMGAVQDLVTKEGAEALSCAVSLREGIGIAVRVADGGYRAVGPALVRTLDLLGLLGARERRALAAIASPPVLGGGRPVGRLVADFDLRVRP